MLKRILLAIAIILTLASQSIAADIPLKWKPSAGATGYKLQISTTRGRTWGEIRDTGSALPEYVWVGAPDKKMLLFKVGSYNDQGESWNNDSGVWVNASRDKLK